MKKTLNITNGDCAAKIISLAKIEGDILPWRDVLHEGPVPSLPLDELSNIRAEYISKRGWGSVSKIKQSFCERDKCLKNYNNYQKVTLWFEHDLYDQLQLLQLLAWFDCQSDVETPVTLICVDQYLGRLSPAEMAELVDEEKVVTEEQLTLATRVWSAFCSPSPDGLQHLLNQDTSALPFLAGAILRLLEEYPSIENGLSRTANQILRNIDNKISHPAQIFAEYSQSEEREFMGDASFWQLLSEMLYAQPALISLPKNILLSLPPEDDQILSITETGKTVLMGNADATDNINLDRWLGGVHLSKENDWRWDAQSKELVKREAI